MESSINTAIQKGYFQQIRYLLDFGLDPNARDADRRTPLINCGLIEDLEWGVGLARMLIEYGATGGLRDKYGLNAFHYACIYERIELLKVFLSAIDFHLNAKDHHGNTALHYAVSTGNTELVRVLLAALDRYNLPVDVPNKKGHTSLIQAYKSHNIECGDLLVDIAGADLDIRDLEDKSALDWKEEALAALEEKRRATKRPRSAFARLQVYHAPAPPPGFSRNKRLSASFRPRSNKENQGSEAEEEVLSRDKISTRLFRSASATDLRNKPEYILNISPLKHFTSENREKSRHGCLVQQENGSWRFRMKTLYEDFDYQFTKTFRKAAKTPEHLIGLHPLRALSPNPSDLGPDSSRTTKGGRRPSMRSPTEAQRKRLGSAASRQRRPSLLSQPGGNKLSAADSSSTESVNSNSKQSKRKNSQELKDDVSEASTLSSKSDKGKGGSADKGKGGSADKGKGGPEPARPVSRAAHHPKETPAANHNLAAIKEEKV